ncbi:MAG: hypothetical protein IKB56_07825 [Clostridia bacterium]|nr:hypothetical protein [Clostridia bacterium]
MKKILIAVLIASLLLVALVGCKPKDDGTVTTEDIFKNFASTGEYSSVRETLRLNEGITVAFYDGDNDVYVTKLTFQLGGATKERYGFCSADKVYVDPIYTAVLDICGDYAICIRTALEGGNEEVNYVGVVKFRGDDGNAYEYGFSYPYAPLIEQFVFLNDNLIAIMGNKNMTDFSSSGYSYATIYDYSSSLGLKEVAVVNGINNGSSFVCEDNYLAVVDNMQARFYDLNQIDSNGQLVRQHAVSLIKAGDGYLETYTSTDVYYMGNGWFIVSSMYSSPEEYDGYEIPLMNPDDGKTYYTLIKSVRFSVKSGKQYDCERVTLVSNKYTDGHVRNLCNSINTEDITATAKWERPYLLPIVPTSAITKEGYSIVYYYYYYYNTENIRSWATSFMICDNECNMTAPTNLVMPPVYVDGYGLQNISPNFKLAMRDVGYHSYLDGSRKTLIPLTEISAFENSFIHNGVIISYEQRIEPQGVVAYLGATKVDGTRITTYEYDSFSPFFGNYATASKIGDWTDEGTIETQAFYRIGLDGTVTSIPDCYQMFNGVYVTRYVETDELDNKTIKFGLKTNSGTVLIPNICEEVSCTDYFFKDDKVFTTRVATVENGAGVIYELA